MPTYIATLNHLDNGRLTADTTVTITGPDIDITVPVPERTEAGIFAPVRIGQALKGQGFRPTRGFDSDPFPVARTTAKEA